MKCTESISDMIGQLSPYLINLGGLGVPTNLSSIAIKKVNNRFGPLIIKVSPFSPSKNFTIISDKYSLLMLEMEMWQKSFKGNHQSNSNKICYEIDLRFCIPIIQSGHIFPSSKHYKRWMRYWDHSPKSKMSKRIRVCTGM